MINGQEDIYLQFDTLIVLEHQDSPNEGQKQLVTFNEQLYQD